jgi:hypothetical protein
MDRREGDGAASPGYGSRGEEVLRSENCQIQLSDTTRGLFASGRRPTLPVPLLRVGLMKPPLDRVGCVLRRNSHAPCVD